MTAISPEIQQIAEAYQVTVIRNDDVGRNSGLCAGKVILLGEFDDRDTELLAFFHELGHALSDQVLKGRSHYFTMLSREGLAWEIGLGIAYSHGYSWDVNHPAMCWARAQYRTYGHM